MSKGLRRAIALYLSIHVILPILLALSALGMILSVAFGVI
jgi:hypothetical protein